MTSTKKLSFLIIVLASNFLIISCGGCSKKKSNPLVREEKRLKNNLKELCKETAWKELEAFFEQDKNNFEKINQHIQSLLVLQEKVNNLEKTIGPIGLKISSKNPLSAQENQTLQSLLKFVSPLKIYPEALANKNLDDLLKKDAPSLNGLLNNPAMLPVIKSFLINQLELWRNLKQQLDTKGTENADHPNES